MDGSQKSNEGRGRKRHDAVLPGQIQKLKKKIQEKCGEIDGSAGFKFFSESCVIDASDPDPLMFLF